MKNKAISIICLVMLFALTLFCATSCGLINRTEQEKAPEATAADTQNTPETEPIPDSEPEALDLNALYLEKIEEYEDRYGEIFVNSGLHGEEVYNNLSGVCYADLIDFDNDDVNELLLCYDTDPTVDGDYSVDGGLRYAIFGEKDGEVTMLCEEPVPIAGNGGIHHELQMVIKNGTHCFTEYSFGSADNTYLERILLKSVHNKEFTVVADYGQGPNDYELYFSDPQYYVNGTNCTESVYTEYANSWLPYITIGFQEHGEYRCYTANKQAISETKAELSA